MTEQLTVGDVNEDRAMKLLHTLTVSDPDYRMVADQLAPLSEVTLTEAEEGTLGHATIAVLLEDTQQAQAIQSLLQEPEGARFDAGISTVATLVTVTFLLRTHIKYARKSNGQWIFQIEHKPADSKILTQLLNKLATLLPTGGE